MKKNSPKKKPENYFQPAPQIGLTVAMGILLLAGLGYLWDQKRGEGSSGLFGGIILGFVYGAYEIWKYYKSLSKKS